MARWSSEACACPVWQVGWTASAAAAAGSEREREQCAMSSSWGSGFSGAGLGAGFGDMSSMLSKATQALEDAKSAAEKQATALQSSNAFSQLESMMAATPGQLVAEVREKAETTTFNPLSGLDYDLLAPSPAKPTASTSGDADAMALVDSVAAFLRASGEAPAPDASADALARALQTRGGLLSAKTADLESNVAQLEESLKAEVTRVSGLLAECENLRAAGAATASKEARAALAGKEAGHREELERVQTYSQSLVHTLQSMESAHSQATSTPLPEDPGNDW